MNLESDNLSAENLLKTVAAERDTAAGSTEAGLKIEENLLVSMGIDTVNFCIYDGSGMSGYNLINPEALVTLLDRMSKEKALFPLFLKSLPTGGYSGTLQHRMRKTAAEGKVFAKTGTITGSSTLSGYVQAAGGEVLAFSIMMENYLGSSQPYRALQDSIAVMMAKFKR
jgi:D-alanyl-D-alanine carboxypeptidase/D-alanyl-D-alanine-endopeptidase (penicillin-binding protein 4)